jgi:signal transduction histidine kinase
VLLTSHQLRTPATAVKGFISMLLDGYAGRISPKQKELMTAAYSENERQISVINSILDVARMEAGEMVLVRRMYDVGKIVTASAEGQAPLLASHHQTVKVIKPDEPVELWVDPTKLQLVTDNLIHNAIKYSAPGTTITLELKRRPRQTVIEVRDQGFGIASRDLPRLFKRFSRISGPHTVNIQGAGLGLYLAEKLVTMHGGSIKVHSREGVGTRFIITLPNIKDPKA